MGITEGRCGGRNAKGEPCGAPVHLVQDGLCVAHRPGGSEAMRARAVRGGEAMRARHGGQAFTAGQLPSIETIEDAKGALDEIRVAVMTRRLTHAEGNAASKAVDSWVKADTAGLTARLVNELRAELDAKASEIAELRKQLAGGPRARVVA